MPETVATAGPLDRWLKWDWSSVDDTGATDAEVRRAIVAVEPTETT